MTGKRKSRIWTLDITEEIINGAVERDSAACVIADAVKRSIPGSQRVAVDIQTIRFTDPVDRKRYVCFTPAYGQKLILDFDQGNRPQLRPVQLRIKAVQVLTSGTSRKPRTPEQRQKEAERIKERRAREYRQRQLEIDDSKDPGNHIPTVIGGQAPPIGALSNIKGRRRAFGLRLAKP